MPHQNRYSINRNCPKGGLIGEEGPPSRRGDVPGSWCPPHGMLVLGGAGYSSDYEKASFTMKMNIFVVVPYT